MNLNLRQADGNDCELLFKWVNDPEVRRASFKSESISLEVHNHWFKKKIHDSNSKIYILEINYKSVGQIRFDYNSSEDNYEIDFSISSSNRGNSLGAKIIQEGIKKMKNEINKKIIVVGKVKSNNIGSLKAFEKNEFNKIKDDGIVTVFQKIIQ